MNPRDCRQITFSQHAFERMFERGIDPDHLATVIADGEVIEERPDDFPLPSCLLLCQLYGAPVHVVLAIDTEDGRCHTISVYWPENDRWDIEFRTRRR